MLEMLLPEYTRQLMENYQSVFSQLASQLRGLYFDDSSRLVTMVDDGWIRVRLDGHWEFTGELLRELSWMLYNIAETGRSMDITTLSKLVRWGREVSPVWVHGDEVTAPVAGTALVSWTVPDDKTGYIYGFFVSAGEGNDFRVNWVSSDVVYSKLIMFPSKGTLHFTDIVALNEGLPADPGTSITITVINNGSTGAVYQAALLVATV
jgi:hypothetical protein